MQPSEQAPKRHCYGFGRERFTSAGGRGRLTAVVLIILREVHWRTLRSAAELWLLIATYDTASGERS